MCAKRMLRAGPASDVVASWPFPRIDERQGVLDLTDPQSADETAEQIIYRLSYALTELRSRLARAQLADEPLTYRAYSATRGWIDKVDAIARQAESFARKLGDVTCIRAPGDPGKDDAAHVNAQITTIAEEADALISALISDAEARGLEPSGPWMKIPLIECREFGIPEPSDPELDEADDARDRQLNS